MLASFPSSEEIQVFTCGDCYLLAIELHFLTGFPIIVGYDVHQNTHEGHVAVMHPNGNVLDIEGYHENTYSYWKQYGVTSWKTIQLEELDIDWWGGPIGFGLCPTETAKKVLAYYGTSPTWAANEPGIPAGNDDSGS